MDLYIASSFIAYRPPNPALDALCHWFWRFFFSVWSLLLECCIFVWSFFVTESHVSFFFYLLEVSIHSLSASRSRCMRHWLSLWNLHLLSLPTIALILQVLLTLHTKPPLVRILSLLHSSWHSSRVKDIRYLHDNYTTIHLQPWYVRYELVPLILLNESFGLRLYLNSWRIHVLIMIANLLIKTFEVGTQ